MTLQNVNTSLPNTAQQGQANPSDRWINIVYIVVGCLIIALGVAAIAPMLLPQSGSNNRASAPVPQSQPAVKAVQDTPVPSSTPLPSITPTSLPTLTPAPTETAIMLVTQIAYAHAESNTPSNCMVTASTMLNLRGDASVKQRAIGRVLAGSVLPVTGRSGDQKWWRVINKTGEVAVEGWVSGQFVTADKTCTDGAIPVIGPTLTPTRTPQGR